MKLINILLLALLAIVPYATSTVHAACDSSCMHRLLYRTAYSSGTTSIKHTMYAYDVFNWCSKDEKDWCPEAIDTTISAVTGRVINSLDIDYDNCDDKCLLSALATVAEKTALYSMQWAEHTFTTSGHYDQDRIQKLHRSVVELITVTPVEVDSGKLNEVMVNKPDLHKPHHQKDKDLAAALPFLAVPLALLSPFAAEALCTNDPVLCNTRTLDYIRRLFDGIKKLLPKSNWLRFMAEAEATGATSCGSSFGEWVDPLNENAPIDPPYNLVYAAAALHWMDWAVVLPRIQRALSPTGVLAIVSDGAAPVPWAADAQRIIDQYSTNRDYRPYNLQQELEQRRLFRETGRHRTEPTPFDQTIYDYVNSYHARNGFSRERMSPSAADAFDDELTAIVSSHTTDTNVRLMIFGDIVWGQPGPID